MRKLITYALAALSVLAVAAACGDEPASETAGGVPTPSAPSPSAGSDLALPDPTPTVAPAPLDPTPTAQAAPAPTPAGGMLTGEYDSNEAMFNIYGNPQQTAETTLLALRSIVDANDTSLVPVLIEFARFMSDPVMAAILSEAIERLTGENFDIGREPRGWLEATEWLAKHSDEYQPPSHYLAWKINLLSAISEGYQIFLGDADRTARIDVTELLWGGVRPDGIPDLQNAPTVAAGEADYLDADERVFGVSINGEHRAYPLRIMNPHEMANDTLGGEPIALAY